MIRAPAAGAKIAGRSTGAVAQLGERRVRNAKVRGSTPLGSTIFFFLDLTQPILIPCPQVPLLAATTFDSCGDYI